MKQSENSPNTSSETLEQMPLKGFRITAKNQKAGWLRQIEGMGDGRYRIHISKIKK
jgi:hypothetical protein